MHERREGRERARLQLVLCRAHADLHADVVPLVGDGTSFVKVVDRRRVEEAPCGLRDPVLPFGVVFAVGGKRVMRSGDWAIRQLGTQVKKRLRSNVQRPMSHEVSF